MPPCASNIGLWTKVALLSLFLGGPGLASGSAAETASSSGLCAYQHPSDARIPWRCQSIPRGETLESLFGDAWPAVVRFNRIDRRHGRPGMKIRVPDRLEDLSEFTPMPRHYSPADDAAQFILIDLSEQFLGAYEYGTLVLSLPVATGRPSHPTPTGDFRIDAADLRHRSSKYTIANTRIPYPMHYGLRFLRTKRGITYWIHGRDLPGYPASHGCVGLYDEAMQVRYYGAPKDVVLEDARRLFEWAVGSLLEGESVREDLDGPRVRVVGRAPRRLGASNQATVGSTPGAPGGTFAGEPAMGVPCRRCGRSYDVTLFQFGRTIWCTCGERVALAPRQRSARARSEPRFFADAMLARLARWLRIAGYDTQYDPHVEDADLVRIALEEGRFILTRDRALPQEWSVEDVLVLDAEDPLQQLREVAARFPLDWRARAFSRCSRCNAPVAPIAPDESAQSIPKRVLAQRLALTRCPECGRTYWEGSHTERMRRVLARALGPGPGSKA